MIVTFYSFKGGVGRSMALVNVGEILADWGYRVILCDWDLEAPGLERYLLENEAPLFDEDRDDYELELETAQKQPGLMDLLLEYKSVLTQPPPEELPSSVKPEHYFRLGKLWLRRPSAYASPVSVYRKRPGSLALLSAGRHEPDWFQKYAEAVRDFDWAEFYEKWGGNSYIEFLRKDLSAGDPQLDIKAAADIVLVDSRTGVTEHGGVTTHHLADVVVLVCAANEANIDGSRWMATALQKSELKEMRGGRDIQLLPLESRIEIVAEKDLLIDFNRYFTRKMRDALPKAIDEGEAFFPTVRIPYVSYYSFRERIVAREEQKHPELYRAYQLLADAIVRCGVSASPKALIDDRVPEETAGRRRSGAGPRLRPMGSIFMPFWPGEPQLAGTVREGLAALGVSVVWPGAGDSPDIDPVTAVREGMEKSVASLIVMGDGVTPSLRAELDAAIREQGRKSGYGVVLLAAGTPPATSQFGSFRPRIVVAPPQLGPNDTPFFESLAAELALPAPVETSAKINPYNVDFAKSESSRFYFGRDDEIREVIGLMEEGLRVQNSKWLIIEGSSGSGKTAFARAGLLPAIQRGLAPSIPRESVIATCILATDFMRDVAGALCATSRFTDLTPQQVRDRLESDPTALRDFVRERFTNERPLVLVIDTFESLFFAGGASTEAIESRATAASAFADRLFECIGETLPFHLVTITRSDVALATMLKAVGFKPVVFELPEMSENGLREAIELPARVTGARFEVGLVERLIDDAQQADQPLPLLQEMLSRLWMACGGGVMTHAAYDALEGLGGLQIAAAERYFNQLSDEDRAVAQELLVRVAWAARTHSGGLPAARVSDLLTSPRLVKKLFVDSGLINLTRDTISLAHPALLEWPRLFDWIRNSYPALQHRDEFEIAVRAWYAAGKPEGGLLYGKQLLYFEEIKPQTEEERTYLEESRKLDRSRRIRRRTSTAVIGTLILAGIVWLTQRAITDYRYGRDAKALASQAMRIRASDPLAAGVLALEAFRKAETLDTVNALNGIIELPALRKLVKFDGNIMALGLSGDNLTVADSKRAALYGAGQRPVATWSTGQRIVSAKLASDVRRVLLELGSGAVVWTPSTTWGFDLASGADLSRDGKLVTTTQFDTAVIYDVQTRRQLAQRRFGESVIDRNVLFSPDSGRVALVGESTVTLWDWQTSKVPVKLSNPVAPTLIAFSEDSQLIAVIGAGYTLSVWDIYGYSVFPSNRLLLPSGPESFSPITSIAFGRLLAVGRENGKVQIFDLLRGNVRTIDASSSRVNALAFSPGGDKLVTCGVEGARIWNVDSWVNEWTLSGQAGGVLKAAFGADPFNIATAGADNTVRVWNLFPATNATVTELGELRGLAESRLPSNLTAEDRAQIMRRYLP